MIYDFYGNKIEYYSNSFKGATMVCFGDSLTEENFQYTKGWHEWVKEILGLASYTNKGKSGDTSNGVYEKINAYNPNGEALVFIMHGSNDTGIANDEERNKIESICNLAKTKFPTAKIVYITPHYQTKYQVGTNTTLNIRSDVLGIAPKYGISVYDNYQYMGLYSSNLTVYTNDNCHWNDLGHEIVGKNLSQWLINTFRKV